MILSDKTMAVRLETVEALNQVEYAKAYKRMGLEPEAAYKKIGSGYAVFAGADSPLTQIFGMGLDGEVADEEVDELEAFFKDRGAAVNVEVCNMADMIFIQKLIERGYTISEFTHVLVRNLSPADEFEVQGDYVIREAGEDEIDTFSRVVAEGFAESSLAQDSLIEVFKVFFRQDNCACFGAFNKGEPAGGGAVFIKDGVAELGGTSTMPKHRNLGIQSGLLRKRLAHAVTKGCDLAMVTTLPGTTSQRNVQRQGFQIAYARTKFTREWK
ncbi:MAG TPA: GNAT family N-acetyltransferase [Blastocatellia bacterium]|nr:GNAT family N-acetyltransferase [Blastocatellia bacterium]